MIIGITTVILIVVVIRYLLLQSGKKSLQISIDNRDKAIQEMINKYSILVERFMKEPNARLFSGGKDYIHISFNSPSEAYAKIRQDPSIMSRGVTVEWYRKPHSPRTWTFPPTVSQNEMVDIITRDIALLKLTMSTKYPTLINKFLEDPTAKIDYDRMDDIKIGVATPHTLSEFIIRENLPDNALEVLWKADLGFIHGKKNKSWKFYKNSVSENDMINRIMGYMKNLANETFKA